MRGCNLAAAAANGSCGMNKLATSILVLAVAERLMAATPPGAGGGGGAVPVSTTEARTFARMIAANETLLYFGGCMIVLLLVAWVVLAIVKNRLFAASKIVRPEKKGVVKNVWAESGRRMETPPAPPSKDDRAKDEQPPDEYPPPGNAL